MQSVAVKNIQEQFLDSQKQRQWLSHYDIPHFDNMKLRVGVVTAGNIPLVGFHDVLCVLSVGAVPVVKLSSKDKYLLPKMLPDAEYVQSVEDMGEIDALITMGGDSAAEYFRQRFKGIPSLIRGSRYSCAILTGRESSDDLAALSEDILLYYGLGCRSVSRIFVPSDYDFSPLIEAVNDFYKKIEKPFFHKIYLKNRAEMIMNGTSFIDSGHICFIEDAERVPVSCVGVIRYDSRDDIDLFAAKNRENIQKIFSTFGIAQSPSLDDYPDGVDTVNFLLNVINAKKVVYDTEI